MAPDDPARLEFLFAEAKDHLDAVVRSIRETSDRAESIVRFNVLVVGLLVTAVSVLARTEEGLTTISPLARWTVVSGFASIVASTAFAVLSYLKRAVVVGLDADEVAEAVETEGDLRDLLGEAIGWYRRAIIRNEEVMSVASRRFRWSLHLLLVGVLLLAAASVLLLGIGGT